MESASDRNGNSDYIMSHLFTASGRKKVLSDSIYKHGASKAFDIQAQPGATLKNIADNISFEKAGWSVKGFSRILIHAGANNLFNKKGRVNARPTLFEHLQEFIALRSVIRRKNSYAVIIFSAILPRRDHFKEHKSFIAGLNFALEKWCARSSGASIFAPTHLAFLGGDGLPNMALLADSDGLHPCGAGVSKLDGLFEQVLSSEYLLERVRSERTLRLRGQAKIPGT